MKFGYPLGFALILLAGCGDSEPKAISTNDGSGSGSGQTISIDTELSADSALIQLSSGAGQAEAEFRFADAAAIWRQIRVHLVARFGQGHWQVANCDQAIAAAERLIQIEPADRTSIDQLRSLEKLATQYSQTGAIRRALACVDQARPLARELFGESAALPLRLQIMAGSLAEQLGDWTTAKKELDAAIVVAQTIYGEQHPDWELACYRLGIVERQLGNTQRSIELLQQAKKMSGALSGRDASFAMRSHDLGVSLQRARRPADALGELDEAEQIWRAELGEQHPLVAKCLVNEAVALIDLERWDAATAKLNDAQQIVTSLSNLPELQQDLWLHRATIFSFQKQFTSAVDELKLALASIERQKGRLNPAHAHVAYRMAMCLGFQAKYVEAEPLFRHALEVQGNLLGKGDEQTHKTLQGLAMLLQRTDRADEAQTLLRQFAYTSAAATPDETQ